MKKTSVSICLTVILLLSCLVACGEKQPARTHKWDPANCTRGELCWSCGEARGEALGHTWVEATCTKAKHCSRCGLTEGKQLDHMPQNETCSRCGETLNTRAYIDAMGHLASHQKTYTVYGGVRFEFPLMGDSGVYSGLPLNYTIYDETRTKITTGQFQKNPPYVLGKDEFGMWIYNKRLETELIPLSPGRYTVEYRYYNAVTVDTYPDTTPESVCVPSGQLEIGICELIVK